MPNVLIIAYYFPPAGGAGVQRTLKFAKYLPDYGWNPVVLTVQSNRRSLQDASLSSEVPSTLEVHHTRAFLMPGWFPWRLKNFIARWLLVLDEQVGWIPYAASEGRRIIEAHNIAAVYSTSLPLSAHRVAEKLLSYSRLPWIADLRDPLVGNFARTFPTRYHRQVIVELEDRICREASAITVVSERMRLNLLKAHSDFQPEKIETIPNGYDRADFQGIRPESLDPSLFHIVYTGSFYAGRLTPDAFLIAVRRLIDEGLILPNSIKIHLIGNVGKPARQAVAETGLTDSVDLPGYLPHHRSIAHILAADLLLLIIGSSPGSEVVLTGKIFEYLAARRPILALAPPGPAADLIREAQAGVVVYPEDQDASREAILSFYYGWQRGELKIDSCAEVIERYDRRRLTAQLAALLDKIQVQKTEP